MVETELLTVVQKRQLVERIAGSDLFRRAPRLREFLLYVADCTLNNRLAGVREQAIAENVFHRDTGSYDLQDSIVRAEARNLRRRLEQYFENEGRDEPVAVLMPKGGYSLSFERRGTAISTRSVTRDKEHADGFAAGSQANVPQIAVGGNARRAASVTRRYQLACAALAIALIVALAVALDTRLQVAASPASPAKSSLPFSALFEPGLDTFIVTSDATVLQLLLLTGERVTINDYIIRSYPEIPRPSRPILSEMLNRFNNTNSDEMAIAGLIMRRNAPFLQRTFLRSGHQVQLADFKGHNMILVGSPISNPWAQLYADRLNFQFGLDRARGITFHNKSPRPGELLEYPAPGDADHHWSYAHLVLLPGVCAPGSVLLIAGTSLGATAAAGEFLLDRERLERELKHAGIDPEGAPRYFELLLRATTFTGGATQSEVIAQRTTNAAFESGR